jgi:hypothetical protein
MATAMPKIKVCNVSDCAYNNKKICHAMAITVGDSHPTCDTYIHGSGKAGVSEITGSVGACKVDSCKFNRSLECSAPEIQVSVHKDHACCNTFTER